MRKPIATAVSVLAGLALAAPSAPASDAYPGTYEGAGKGVSADVVVKDDGSGVLAYRMRSDCGTARGKIELKKSAGAFKGKRLSRGPEATLRTTAAKLAPTGDGTTIAGVIKDSLRGGDSELAGCKDARRFEAELEKTEAFIPSRDTGRYTGQSAGGLPIAFDLLDDPAGAGYRIENLAARVEADCYDLTDEDGDELTMITNVTGLAGRVDRDGGFYAHLAPDADSEFDADGTIGAGEARVDVLVSGRFDAAGNPSPSGQYYCDSWGAIYTARLAG